MSSESQASLPVPVDDGPIPVDDGPIPVDDGPIPLSFPSILRNPGISDRFGRLSSIKPNNIVPTVVKRNRRDDKEGKRWIRRQENARFVGNPHVVQATKKDYILQPTTAKQTFPEPLPSYLPRNSKVPNGIAPSFDPNSANAGRFSLSLRGMRRDLKKAGFRAEMLVRNVEDEILPWLQLTEPVLSPDDQRQTLEYPGRPIGESGTIFELSRTHLQLVWHINNDAFARYVVHCCARYHEVVSFSKDTSGERLTYILRPNIVTRPDALAVRSLDTPPATDIDSSQLGSEISDFSEGDRLSDIASDSEVEPTAGARPLSAISEASPSSSDDWLVVGDHNSDIDSDESGSDAGLSASLDSLSIQPIHRTPRQGTPHVRVWNRQLRANSSPSRSPARIRMRRPRVPLHTRPPPPRSNVKEKPTLYEYIFL